MSFTPIPRWRDPPPELSGEGARGGPRGGGPGVIQGRGPGGNPGEEGAQEPLEPSKGPGPVGQKGRKIRRK